MRVINIESEGGRIITAHYERPKARRRAEWMDKLAAFEVQEGKVAAGVETIAALVREYTNYISIAGVTSGPVEWPNEDDDYLTDVLEDGELGAISEAILANNGYGPLSPTPGGAG